MSLLDKKEIGRRLVELEKALTLNSRQFAMGADLDVSYVGKIEKGEKPMSGKYLEKIINKYSVNKEWLLTGKGEMFIPNVPHETANSGNIMEDRQAEYNSSPGWDAIMKVAEGNKVLYDANRTLADANLILARNNERLVTMLETKMKGTEMINQMASPGQEGTAAPKKNVPVK